jgi:hypothetical protein
MLERIFYIAEKLNQVYWVNMKYSYEKYEYLDYLPVFISRNIYSYWEKIYK